MPCPVWTHANTVANNGTAAHCWNIATQISSIDKDTELKDLKCTSLTKSAEEPGTFRALKRDPRDSPK